jgi:sterol 3beta-glucosyltransferase
MQQTSKPRARIRSPVGGPASAIRRDPEAEDVARPSRAADLNKSLFSIITDPKYLRSGDLQDRFNDVSTDEETGDDEDEDEDDNDDEVATRGHEHLHSRLDSRSMVTSQILRPPMRQDSDQSSSQSEAAAPYLSMILKGEADMDAEDQPSAADEALIQIQEPAEPSAVSLAQRLKEIFELEEPEDVVSEFPCWLLHTVLLSGHLYITTKHICFYAYCPKLATTAVKSGWLRKRGQHNPRYKRYYMELKGDVLRYYHDRLDVYMPSGHIDLRFGISATVEPESKKSGRDKSSYFKVVTKDREYLFKADNHDTARDWVKHLQRVIFRSHNSGDSVKICLPIANIIDAEEERVLDVSDTIKLRVLENIETYGLDEVCLQPHC